MAIRRFEATNVTDSSDVDEKVGEGTPQQKVDLSAEVRARMDKANEYFNKTPPRANIPDEVAAFFTNLVF